MQYFYKLYKKIKIQTYSVNNKNITRKPRKSTEKSTEIRFETVLENLSEISVDIFFSLVGDFNLRIKYTNHVHVRKPSSVTCSSLEI